MVEVDGILQAELRIELPGGFKLSKANIFGDFLWDRDLTRKEIFALDPSVIVDFEGTERRVILMRIRGEIRFWICTDRDAVESTAKSGLGVLRDLEQAVTLCREFLVTRMPIEQLATPPVRIFDASLLGGPDE